MLTERTIEEEIERVKLLAIELDTSFVIGILHTRYICDFNGLTFEEIPSEKMAALIQALRYIRRNVKDPRENEKD